MEELTPREIVAELDKYIVGQDQAKRAVAIALRNRLRRQKVAGDLQDDIIPKNILMIGPTGVGKTEICRRLAKLVNAPFVKVEASKFTEVGYVGRDVESIVRDLVENAVSMVRKENIQQVRDKAEALAEERLVDILCPMPKRRRTAPNPFEVLFNPVQQEQEHDEEDEFNEKVRRARARRQIIREQLKSGELEDQEIEIEVADTSAPRVEFFDGVGMQEMEINMQDLFGGLLPKRTKKRRVPIREARRILTQEEAGKLVDEDTIVAEAIRRCEKLGIVFLDELDKIAGREAGAGPDVSREGVQ
ncbi:MAG TPA: HslU--HslV peptidase ATPase subunit, partial [Clostridiales bacterium UBA9857]|nr:HslU--HslV peptidase ATPase subunit [Clostridiales bacterium UBA9857]